MSLLPEPDLEAVLARWATARLRAHQVITRKETVTEAAFLDVMRAAEDVPLLVAKIRRAA